jgi:hyperosmotically inducible protein
VETFRGIVLLSGFVDSEQQKQRAIEVTRGVAGVRDVRHLLVVKYLEKP